MERLYLQKHDASATRCELVLEQATVHAGTAEDYASANEDVKAGDRLIIVDARDCYVYEVVKPEPTPPPAVLAAPNGEAI